MRFIFFLFLRFDQESDQELFVGIIFMITKQKVCDKPQYYPLLKTYLSPLLRDFQWVLCF